jgi:hypothetical protein
MVVACTAGCANVMSTGDEASPADLLLSMAWALLLSQLLAVAGQSGGIIAMMAAVLMLAVAAVCCPAMLCKLGQLLQWPAVQLCQLLHPHLLLFVDWAMLPWLPLYQRLSRAEVIRRGHLCRLYLKASSLKQYLHPRRGNTLPARRQPPAPTHGHRLLLLVLTCSLVGSTMASGLGAGRAVGMVGLGGEVVADWRAVNLRHLAMADLPHSMRRRHSPTVPRPPVPAAAAAPCDSAASAAAFPAGPAADAATAAPSAGAAVSSAPSFACMDPYMPEGPAQDNPSASQYQKDPEHGWVFGMHPSMSDAHQQQLQELLVQHKSQFAYCMADLTGYTGQHPPLTIELTDDEPTISAQRKYSPAEVAIRTEKREELVGAGISVPAPKGCKWASCPTMPAKKNANGEWAEKRFCQDYRAVNDKTKMDYYALPLPEDLFYKVCASKIFSKIDLRGAFHQLPICPADQPKTAWWDGNALMMYTRLPYGIKTGPAHCQRVVDYEIASSGLSACCVAFVDDLCIHSATMEEHIKHVGMVLDMLEACGLKAHPDKCLFAADRLEYLGHMIGEGSLTPHQSKVETIRTLRTPANVSELRSVIGFMNYYRVYLPSFSTMCAPLNELLKKGVPWEWGPAQAASYQALKEGLCKEGNALKRFSTDPGVKTVVYTDWSGVGIGAVLGQIGPDGQEHMVACISRSLNKHERNYSSYAGEMLACVWAVKSFRHYLHGISFQICTDHQPLTWLMRTAELQGKHARWAMLLQEYDFQIVHRPGLQHQNADVLSRFPSPSTYDPTGACLDSEQCSPPSPASLLARVAVCLQTRQAVDQAVYEAVFTAAPVSGFMDCYAPAAADVLQGNMGTLGDVGAPEPELNAPVVSAEQQHLRQLAAGWVHGATEVLQRMRTTVPQPLLCGPDISVWGSREVQQLSTVPVGGAVFQAAMQKGVTLYEPFGGMCSGLDSLLANGFTVARYLYSDVDPAAVAVAQLRLDKLHGLYPVSFPLSASADAFTALPADVTAVGAPALVSAGALDGTQWVVVAGWSCQDLSRGGAGLGLEGSRSCTFYDAVRIVGALQQMQSVPPAFIFENTYMQDDNRHSVLESFNIICKVLGQPVVVDAARFGAFAHRARNYWSNMASPQWVQAVCDGVQRAPDRFVNSVLDVGREVAFQQNPRSPPFYSCNVPGAHVSALPTLVARPSSWSFRSNGTGMIRDLATGVLSEPNPDERERLMGFSGHDTAAPGVAPVARHAIVGNAMDRFTTTSLFAIYGALGNFSDHLAASAAPYQRPRVCCAATWQQLPAQPGSGGGKGEAMLRQWGWAPGRSLGTSHSPTALQQPVHIRHQRDRAGVGWNITHEHCFVSDVAGEHDPAVLPAAQPAVSAGNTPPVPYPAGDTPFQLVVENAACDANAQQAEGIVIAATGADADV